MKFKLNISPQTSIYRATLVDLTPIAQLFPQTNVDSSTMVHLWPKVSLIISCLSSFSGLWGSGTYYHLLDWSIQPLQQQGANRHLRDFPQVPWCLQTTQQLQDEDPSWRLVQRGLEGDSVLEVPRTCALGLHQSTEP